MSVRGVPRRNSRRHRQARRRNFLLSTALICLLSGTTSNRLVCLAQGAGLAFEVATIKPAPPGEHRWQMQFKVDGFTARGVELRKVIQEAFGTYEEDRLVGGAAWVNTAKFDIEAKIDDADSDGFEELTLPERRTMLQSLLADRFKLTISREKRSMPVFTLAVAKNGPKLKRSASDSVPEMGVKGYSALVTHSQPGELDVQNCSMSDLASLLNDRAGRTVLDKTHLTERYDLSLRWKPDNDVEAAGPALPSLFTAMQEQLGLRLEPAKAAIEILVIDHVERPSEN